MKFSCELYLWVSGYLAEQNNQIATTPMCENLRCGPIIDQLIKLLTFIMWRDVMLVAILVLQEGDKINPLI